MTFQKIQFCFSYLPWLCLNYISSWFWLRFQPSPFNSKLHPYRWSTRPWKSHLKSLDLSCPSLKELDKAGGVEGGDMGWGQPSKKGASSTAFYGKVLRILWKDATGKLWEGRAQKQLAKVVTGCSSFVGWFSLQSTVLAPPLQTQQPVFSG